MQLNKSNKIAVQCIFIAPCQTEKKCVYRFVAQQNNWCRRQIIFRCLLEPVATFEVQINSRYPLAVLILCHGPVFARIPLCHIVDPQPCEMVQLLIKFQWCGESPAIFHFLGTVIPAIAAKMPNRSNRRILTYVTNRAFGSNIILLNFEPSEQDTLSKFFYTRNTLRCKYVHVNLKISILNIVLFKYIISFKNIGGQSCRKSLIWWKFLLISIRHYFFS